MKTLRISITDADGIVIDRFLLTHWKNEELDEKLDYENFGSPASESMLLDRIRRNFEEK